MKAKEMTEGKRKSNAKPITQLELNALIKEKLDAKERAMIGCGKGLILQINQYGGMAWVARIRKDNGKYTTKVIGAYGGDLKLAEARAKAQEMAAGSSHSYETNKAELSKSPKFGDFKREWLTKKTNEDGLSIGRLDGITRYMNKLSGLDGYRLSEITPTILKQALDALPGETVGNKRRAVSTFNQSMLYAISMGYLETNMCRDMCTGSEGAYKAPTVKNFAAVPASELGKVFFTPLSNTAIAQPRNAVFFLFTALSLLRVGSIAALKWDWIDFDAGVIHVPTAYMKTKKHFEKIGRKTFDVPMTVQIKALLQWWKAQGMATGSAVFPLNKNPDQSVKPTNFNAPVSLVLKGKHTLHGFRSSFRSWAADNGISDLIGEITLSHVEGSTVVQAYQRSDRLEQRREALQAWNDYLTQTQLTPEFKALLGDADPAESTKNAGNEFEVVA